MTATLSSADMVKILAAANGTHCSFIHDFALTRRYLVFHIAQGYDRDDGTLELDLVRYPEFPRLERPASSLRARPPGPGPEDRASDHRPRGRYSIVVPENRTAI